MKAALSTLTLIAAVAFAQDRCDAPYPKVFCNTTEILAFESPDCKPYHVFIARGSDEPYPGRQANLTGEICSRLGSNDCGFENIVYPAKSTAWGKEEWCKSATAGAANGQAQMKAYGQKCPNAKLILLGFSQGAAVAQDLLAGGGGKVFQCEQPSSPALDSSIGDKVVAAVTFGSVIRSRNQNFTIGDGVSFDGQRARTTEQLEALNKYSDRLRDYCHKGDPMCAVGSTPVNVYVHLNYFLEHNEEVVSWVAEKAKSSSGQVSDGTQPSNPSSSLASSPFSTILGPQPTSSPEKASTPTTSTTPTLASSSNTPSSSFISSSTNTSFQSRPTTSAIAGSAAATPSIIASATQSPADTSEAQPTQSAAIQETGTQSTGAAQALMVSPLLAIAVAALCFVV
jgi:hypothetical protein